MTIHDTIARIDGDATKIAILMEAVEEAGVRFNDIIAALKDVVAEVENGIEAPIYMSCDASSGYDCGTGYVADKIQNIIDGWTDEYKGNESD